MATISSMGVGSGLDIEGLVKQLVTVERMPMENRLNKNEAAFQAKLTAYGAVKGALSAFQSALQSLKSASNYQSLKAVSADTSIYTASASAQAVAGSYSIEVKQLAQAHKVASKAFSAHTDTLGAGTLTFQFGTYSGGSFTPNSDAPVQTVTIDSANNTLSGIRDAVNAANIGVSASILNDGSGNKLIFTAKSTGANNSLKITVSNDSVGTDLDDNGLSQLAYNPAGALGNGKNMAETVAAQNAILKVDGIDNISKSSNVVTDVIEGVTLNLAKQSAVNSPTILTVSLDANSIQASVQGFVKAYNDLIKGIKEVSAYDAANKKANTLTGDATVLTITSQIRRVINSTTAGLSGAYNSLGQIGIAFDNDGNMRLDTAKLGNALSGNINDIIGFFANLGAATDSQINYVSASTKTKAGDYAVYVSQLARQGSYTGAGTAALADTITPGTFDSPFVIDANNDTFMVKVDGIQSGTISLSQASYTTAAALASELQSKINGDSALKNSNVKVTVSFDSAADRFVISSDKYGSASTVEITAIDVDTTASLGFSVAAGVAGVDVAGTINGQAAVGSGRYLTGAVATDVEGLKLEVIGGSTGDRGSIRYTQGYAYQLDALMTNLLEAKGPLDARTTGLNKSLQDINSQREALAQRMIDVEKRYRAQFSVLDTLLSNIQTTSNFLTQQLANIQKLTQNT